LTTQTRVPTADVDANWSGSELGYSNHSHIDEYPDLTTSYLYTATNSLSDKYSYSAFTVFGAVTRVIVYAYAYASTGYTKNVNRRAKLHARGTGAKYTKAHKPKKVVYVETLGSRAEAMKREKAIKKLSHQQKIDLVKPSRKNVSSDKKSQSQPSA
jgi:putative endonuclease